MGEDEDRVRVPARIGNWLLESNLGSGYSGSIWKAKNPFTDQTAAIKVQDVDHECPTNRYERNFYPSLQGGKGMPTLWAAGVQGEYDYLVIDLLGPSLDNLYRKNGKILDLRSTLCIAMQVISRLEFMHSRGILHRDIQLGNCTIGLANKKHIIYMIDFGFSKRYIDPHTHKHIPDSKAKRDFIGNYWFSSINVHCRGKVPSRRDDMEALALMLIHVLTENGLPWTRNGVPKNDKAHDALIRKKLKARPEDLCHHLPHPVFEDFLRYCRRLKFLEQPDYRYWREEFEKVASEMGYAEPDGSVSDDFVWPPRPDVALPPYESLITPQRKDAGDEVDIYMILNEIANMRLENSKLVDGARRTDPTLPPPAPAPTPASRDKRNSAPTSTDSINKPGPSKERKPSPPRKSKSNSSKGKGAVVYSNVIVISDSSDEDSKPSRQFDRTAKQAAMRLLARRARAATDKEVLADLLHQFLETYALTGARSRVITRDAFNFLDALVQQLENPSVFVASESDGAQSSQVESRLRHRTPPSSKTETVKVLKQRLQVAPSSISNAQLATYLSDFCQAVRSTTGKTLTKDGVAFLEGIESRLKRA